MIWFAKHLLNSYAMESVDDADLPDGFHLRLMLDKRIGMPLTPFLICPMQTRLLIKESQFFSNNDGTQRVVVPKVGAGDGVIVAAHANWNDGSSNWLAAMYGDGERIAVKRSQRPFQIAAPRIHRLRISSAPKSLYYFLVQPTELEKMITGESFYPPLALPVAAQLPWYAGGTGRASGKQRVKAGAPRRMTPLDQPDGSRSPLTPDDEWARLAPQADEADRMLSALLGQANQLPVEVMHTQKGMDESGLTQSVSSQLLSDVMLRAIDPGLARYLGFATVLKDSGQIPVTKSNMFAFGAVALFALPGPVVDQLKRFGIGPPERESDEHTIGLFVKRFPGLDQVVNLARKSGYWVGALSTVTAAPKSPDTPSIPKLSTQLGRWRSNDNGGTFAQGFIIARPPFAPLVAVARKDGSSWVPRHNMSQTGRRNLRLVGTRTDPSPPSGQAGETQGIVYEDPISGRTPPRFRLALGDLFGRYGKPAECDAQAPPRPGPPAPVVQTFVQRASALTPTGAASPGVLALRVPIPPADDLALGALPIVTVKVVFDAATHNEAANMPLLLRSYPISTLLPQQVKLFDLSVKFVDTAGSESEPFIQKIELADARAPVAIPFGYGLIWTSRPGAAQDVQLAIDWPAPVGQQHRVYIADAASLGLAGPSRAAVADAGVKRALAGEISGPDFRKCFRLISDTSVPAGADGWVRFRATLPRALQTVQFVRIVPIGPGGVETDFDMCGLVPVAVPADRGPPPPRLRLLPAAEGQLPQFKVEATGLNLAMLAQAEPGLFVGGDTTRAESPEYRIRRASGLVPDPIYAREIVRGSLIREGVGNTLIFGKVLKDNASAVPFVRYTYWAEARMPPERRVLDQPLPIAGAVTGAASAQTVHCPAIWSSVSAPLSVVHAPAGEPAAPALSNLDASFIVGAARIEITLRNAPPMGPGGQWLLRIWRGAEGQSLKQVIPDAPILSTSVSWGEAVRVGTTRVNLVVALVDPMGRQSQVIKLAALNK